jgi:diguanylate cyclase (GGDEF)-like protein
MSEHQALVQASGETGIIMATAPGNFESIPPVHCVAEVYSELPAPMIQNHWRKVNALLRFSMLTGMQMQLDPTMNLLCDYAAEICGFDAALTFLWDEALERTQLRLQRNLTLPDAGTGLYGNLLNFWSHQANRPLLVTEGDSKESDALLHSLGMRSAIAVPLFVKNRVAGSMQFFSVRPARFTPEDAQLLWILALVAENLLTRETENESLLRFAFTDFLTGLRTRGYFEQQLEMEIKRASRKRQTLALLMLDIDHFKALNDTYGHHVGDQVLREVGALLLKDMREADTVARYGGEEFVMILPETSATGARHVAQKVRRAMERANLSGPVEASRHVTISIGYAIFPRDAATKRDVIDFADRALYEAKRQGRNRVVAFSELSADKEAVGD